MFKRSLAVEESPRGVPLRWQYAKSGRPTWQNGLSRCEFHRPRARSGAFGKNHAAVLLPAVDFDDQVGFRGRQIRRGAENAVIRSNLCQREPMTIGHQPAAYRRRITAFSHFPLPYRADHRENEPAEFILPNLGRSAILR